MEEHHIGDTAMRYRLEMETKEAYVYVYMPSVHELMVAAENICQTPSFVLVLGTRGRDMLTGIPFDV